MTTTTDIRIECQTLPEGSMIIKTYWSVAGHYGPAMESRHQLDAENFAREHPTQTETLSYEQIAAGVKPEGWGTVELRAKIARGEGGQLDAPIMRYRVHSPRST